MFTIYCSPSPAQCCRCHKFQPFYICLMLTPLPLHTYLESHGAVLFFTLRNVSKWLSFSADDDSEPILGLWFEETISPTKDKVAPPPPPPPPPLETSPRLKSPSKQNPSENGNILAGRKDPELVRSEFCVPADLSLLTAYGRF